MKVGSGLHTKTFSGLKAVSDSELVDVVFRGSNKPTHRISWHKPARNKKLLNSK